MQNKAIASAARNAPKTNYLAERSFAEKQKRVSRRSESQVELGLIKNCTASTTVRAKQTQLVALRTSRIKGNCQIILGESTLTRLSPSNLKLTELKGPNSGVAR